MCLQSVRDGDGKEVSLAQYAGKVAVVVNVASQCGYTEANYKGLTKIYKKFRDQGLVVCACLQSYQHEICRGCGSNQGSMAMTRMLSSSSLPGLLSGAFAAGPTARSCRGTTLSVPQRSCGRHASIR